MIYGSVVPFSFAEEAAAIKALIKGSDRTSLFEKKTGEYFGAEALAVDSGLTAIRLVLRAAGLKPGDEVAVPAYLCERVGRGLLSEGYTLKYIEAGDDYNMLPEDLAKKATKKTKAVLAVHSYGIPCRMDEITKIARACGAVIVDDSAQSFGGRYKGRLLGTFGSAGVLSFGWIKPLCAMGGGALITSDRALLSKAKGILQRRSTLKSGIIKTGKAVFYLNKPLFHKVALGLYSDGAKHVQTPADQNAGSGRTRPIVSDLHRAQSAIGLVQLGSIDEFNRRRAFNSGYLAGRLSGLPIELPDFPDGTPLLRLPARFKDMGAKEASARYLSMGIEAPALYPSLPDLFGEKDRCPNATRLASQTVNLPVHPCLDRDALDRIVAATKKICGM